MGGLAAAVPFFCRTQRPGEAPTGLAVHLRGVVGAEPLESTEPWLPLMQSETKTGNAFCAAVDSIKQKIRGVQRALETAGAAAPVVEGDLTRRLPQNFTIGPATRKRITMEYERHVAATVTMGFRQALPITDQRRLAYEHCDPLITPRVFDAVPSSWETRLPNDTFQMWAQHVLGVPKAVCAHLIGERIHGGHHNTEAAPKFVDEHGNSFASVGVENSWDTRHNTIRDGAEELLKWAGIRCEKERRNLFARFFQAEPVSDGEDNGGTEGNTSGRARQGCRPDLYFRTRMGAALAEIKTLGAAPSNYPVEGSSLSQVVRGGQFARGDPRHPEYVKPVDRRAALVHGEYETKLRNAAVRTGDSATDRRWGNRTPAQEEVGEAAVTFLNTRFGQVKPLVAGAFGDINKGFEDFIRLVVDARVGGEAEASPGVRSVAMMHVRQRIGVLIARATTEFILAGVMNSGNDIDPVAEREAQLQRRENYNSRQLQHREEIRLFRGHSFRDHSSTFPHGPPRAGMVGLF